MTEFTSAHVSRRLGWTKPIAWFFSRLIWWIRVRGAENVPKDGPVILAANHIGLGDGPLLFMASPRGAHFMTKKSMIDGRLGWLLKASGQFPVDRNNGRVGLQIALDLLREGRVVAMFPEGTRGTGTGADLKAGVAWLAQRSGAPVVPVAILGTRPRGASVGYIPRPWTRPWFVFGEPIVMPEDLPAGRAGTTRALELISERLSEHVARTSAHTGVQLPGDNGRRDKADIGRGRERT